MGKRSLAVALFGLSLLAQNRFGKLLLRPGDDAVLAARDARRDLPCTLVEKTKPTLGYDLRLWAGYTLRLPPLEGDLRLLTRLTFQNDTNEPNFFTARYRLSGGEAFLPVRFPVAPGRYRLDILLRDQADRVCSDHWEITARLPSNVDPAPLDDDAPVPRSGSLHVQFLLYLLPPRPGAATLDASEIDDLLGMLRAFAREPRFDRFSVIAFQPAQGRTVFRQDAVPRLDFAALRAALAQVDFVRIAFRPAALSLTGDDDLTIRLEPQRLSAAGRSYTILTPNCFASAWHDLRRRLPTAPGDRK
jgi:hypothetical protein